MSNRNISKKFIYAKANTQGHTWQMQEGFVLVMFLLSPLWAGRIFQLICREDTIIEFSKDIIIAHSAMKSYSPSPCWDA